MLLLLLFAVIILKGQTQPYGMIDTADLKLTSCDFEKGAGAMVLFDKARVIYKFSSIIMERHKRIKIFNDQNKDEANIRIEFYGAHHDEDITEIEAETINLTNKTITYTNIDKKLIYTEVIDKDRKAIIFTFPDVRAGSVIEFKYKLSTSYSYNYPDWLFQSSIPTRYSEFDASFNDEFRFNILKKVHQLMVVDTLMNSTHPRGARHIWALSNIKSYTEEPYMDYPDDYLQRIQFKIARKDQTWDKIGRIMLDDEDFGPQLTRNLSGADDIIAKANALKTQDEKIRYLFNTVKSLMKWNREDYWYTINGVKKAWDKKTGNSTEINLVLFNLLKTAGVPVYLMALKTRDNGRLDPDYPNLQQLNKTVVYCSFDLSKYYVLDASNPYNTYDNIPYDLIGLNVLTMDTENKRFGMFPLKSGTAKEVTLINGSIGADGKFEGTSQTSSLSYSREKYLKKHEQLNEKKYIDELQKKSNGLNISSIKFENIENDTVPLIQTIEFKYNLNEPDGNYIYFNPNLLIGFQTNPFKSEGRVSNIDFRCLNNYSINERYKIPAGYKIDALPKSLSLIMPDKSISFKRAVAEQDGFILVFCTLNYTRAIFTADEYPGIRDFYKKMYEMLNEQIVLKKS